MSDNEGCFVAMFWGMSAVTVFLLWWFFGIAWALVAALGILLFVVLAVIGSAGGVL